MKRSYGRIHIEDPRDKKFTLTAPIAKNKIKNWSYNGWVGDQTTYPACVGFGWSGWLYSSPIKQWLNPFAIYQFAQYIDEWPGEDYEGTSVRAGAKLLKSLGAIKEYRWSWDATVVVNHILTTGPVVVGTNWYSGMNDVDKEGMMKVTGTILGGHCYLLLGYNSKTQLLKVKNSYGNTWGNWGFGYISLTDMQRLLTEDGEGCIGVEQGFSPENA